MIINRLIKERRTSGAFSLERMEKIRSSTLATKSMEQSPALRIDRTLRVPRYNRTADTPSLTVNAHTARAESTRDGVDWIF
jgi:hypothetical protein